MTTEPDKIEQLLQRQVADARTRLVDNVAERDRIVHMLPELLDTLCKTESELRHYLDKKHATNQPPITECESCGRPGDAIACVDCIGLE